MAKRKVVYVTPATKGNWSVKTEGAERALKNFENKKDAVDFGRQVAKDASGQLKIQKKDGTFQTEYTYGNDPYPPEG
ncbi:DUF2188 domain-containing protein [Desulfatiglans anilini]|uniref:DUF2188 domain-containing protein n=1 Tax=Desulfatiglans anilini TaxID=90728 RepID=UPI0004216549|nr:DUF2188 domain-containing protein [Desulfatiglans anilini]